MIYHSRLVEVEHVPLEAEARVEALIADRTAHALAMPKQKKDPTKDEKADKFTKL